jgi:AbrB family looped-hinge helix DNA binding protein
MTASERPTTVVSTKGQVVLPKTIRQRLNWTPGARLEVEETPDGVFLRRAPLFERSEFSDVFAMLKTSGPARSPDDMDAAVLAEARRKNAGD